MYTFITLESLSPKQFVAINLNGKLVASATIPDSVPFSNVIPDGKTVELHEPSLDTDPSPLTTVGADGAHIGRSRPCDTVIFFEFPSQSVYSNNVDPVPPVNTY